MNSSKITSLVFLIFLALKLTGKINWSWIWITFPIWYNWIYLIILICFAEKVRQSGSQMSETKKYESDLRFKRGIEKIISLKDERRESNQ